ncbi:MAG TPA: NfeD family protein [Actinomycetota bacterium]|nr:NfeD family protein [Actinomycetota bacterium]
MSAPKLLACLTIASGLLSLGGAAATTHPEPKHGPIDIVEIEGLIDPPLSRYIQARVAAAERDGAQAVVFRIDAPGSTSVGIDEFVPAVAEAEVPVVAWVAPRGAKAIDQAATLVLMSDVVFAADGAEIRTNGRPIEEVERRISTSGRASSLADLLQALDGTTVGGEVIESWDEDLAAPGVVLRFQELPLWDRLLHSVVDPEVALFLILLGAFGFIFEVYNPGIGIAAILGAALLGLGFYALDVLPTNWWALLVIVGALGALVYDVHVAGFGIWTIGGLAALGVGSWLLFPGGNPALDVGPLGIAVAIVLSIVFFVSVMTAALRVRLRRPIDDSEGIIGNVAEAHTDIAPEGTVLTKGVLWRARTMETGIAAGQKVQVKATEGLVLLVEPWHGD